MFKRLLKKEVRDADIYAPVDGEMINIEDVADAVFSSKMMGDGVAFRFEGDIVYSPCAGELTMVANTNHAFGITMANGVEVLVHIGLDTVNLGGIGLTVLASKGSSVSKGTPLIKINRELMKEKEIDLTTPMVIMNKNGHELNQVIKSQLVLLGQIIYKI